MPPPLLCFLHRLQLRNTVSAEEEAALLAIQAPLVEVRSRWDLVRPGEKVTFACLVASGIAARSEQFGDGRRQTTALYIAGDMCDLHSLPVPRAGWAITALTDCTIYQVPHTALHEVALRFPNLAEAFWRDTVVDGSIMSKWVGVLGRLPVRQRLAHLLCEFGWRMEAARLGQRAAFELNLTQEQLAEMLGATSVHLSRVFKQLCGEGVIATQRRSIRVLDMDALERIANFDPTYLLFSPE